MTMPGVQNPHWEPWLLAILSWTGCSLVLVLPIPSTVVTAIWCKEQMGARQALAEKWLEPQIKVVSLSSQVIRADLSAGLGRSVMLCVISLHSTSWSCLFHRCPHLSTQGSGPELLQGPLGSGISAPRHLSWNTGASINFSCLFLSPTLEAK